MKPPVTSQSRERDKVMNIAAPEQEVWSVAVTRGGGFYMNLENLVVLVLIAAVCGFVAERMTQGRLPYGLVGAIFGALLGSWLLVEMFRWKIPGDMTAGGVPVLTAILGAAAVIFVLSVATRSKTQPAPDRKRS